MQEEKEVKQEKAKEAEVAKEGSNKFLFIGLVAGVIILNAVVAFVLVFGTIKKMNPKEEDMGAADTLSRDGGMAVTIGAISEPPIEAIVNIIGTDGMRFLKVVVVLEYDNKEYPKLGEELARHEPKLKNILIDILSEIPLEELQKPDTKDEIRRDLIRQTNKMLPKNIGQIRDVFFNDFIIQ